MASVMPFHLAERPIQAQKCEGVRRWPCPFLVGKVGGWLLRELVEVQVEAEDVDAGLTENA